MENGFRRTLILTAVCIASASWLTKCGGDGPSYTVSSDFYWSNDAGKTYGNRTKEYLVGENVYMQLIIRIDSTEDKQEEIGVSLAIPYIKDVVSRYLDGQIITPQVDELNHLTTYNFTVLASSETKDTNFVFRFVPTVATDITLSLTFDDKISSVYDKQNTITFIDPNASSDSKDSANSAE